MLIAPTFHHSFLRGLCCFAILSVAAACGDDDGKQPADAGTQTGSGKSGEACSADQLCGEGLVCSSGKCAAGGALTLNVDGAARGCELSLTDAADAKVTEVRFGAGVTGSFVRRAPRLGVSFISAKDEAIPGGQISLFVAGEGLPKIARTVCVDSKGKALPKAVVSLVK
jgi:hypothetical protein